MTPRGRRVLTVVALALLVPVSLAIRAAFPSSSSTEAAESGVTTLTSSAARPAPPLEGTPAFATIRGLALHIPSAQLVAIGYHEAATPQALRLHPLGSCVRDANRTKFDPPPARSGPQYIVMSSRGRPHPATSAVDLAMPAGTAVEAPVSGRVVGLRKYWLYGRYEDLHLVIAPDDQPHLRVVMIHLTGVRVSRGDHIVAGVSVIGTPRVFPFNSQINDYIGPGIPHVHVEVTAVGDQGR